MSAFLAAIKSPEAWFSAIFLAAVLVVPAGINEWLKESPRNTENAQADQRMSDQREEDHQAQAIKACLARRGEGAVPVIQNGVVVACKRRRS